MALVRKFDSNKSLLLYAAGALLISTTSIAADRSSAETVYQRDRAACNSGQSGQDRATCLREAGAARQEARRGRLEDGQGEFERNRLLRCDSQPLQDREDCVRRMNGEGTTSGSVQGGGILRELVTPVVPPQRN
jgi:hypothetical protein